MANIIAGLISLVLFALIAASLILYFKCFGRVKRVYDFTKEEEIIKSGLGKFSKLILPAFKKLMETPCEEIHIKSFDNTDLFARFYTVANPKGTIALFHGWRSAGVNDFSCIVFEYNSLGYNVLMPDQRAHGKSGGGFITMGGKEKYDCKAWMDYISERFGGNHNIFLDGISMGASTVLMASGLELPANVKGIIADSGFTSAQEVVLSVARNAKIPPYPLIWLVEFWFWIFGGCSMGKESTLTAVKKNKLPILFIHGEGDTFVPCQMTRRAYEEAVCEKYIFTVPEANHGQSYLYKTEECTELLRDFLAKYNR